MIIWRIILSRHRYVSFNYKTFLRKQNSHQHNFSFSSGNRHPLISKWYQSHLYYFFIALFNWAARGHFEGQGRKRVLSFFLCCLMTTLMQDLNAHSDIVESAEKKTFRSVCNIWAPGCLTILGISPVYQCDIAWIWQGDDSLNWQVKLILFMRRTLQ